MTDSNLVLTGTASQILTALRDGTCVWKTLL